MRAFLALPVCFLLATGCTTERPDIAIPAGIDHAPWTAMLELYVDDRGLVDYDAWRADEDDRAALDAYLADYAEVEEGEAEGAARHAALINAYNAFVIREVLRVDPEDSLWDHSPFGKRKHRIGGRDVSLDDIEHGAGRPEIGFRIHAAVVCAAVSCPPLRRQAFVADRLDEQLDDQMRTWLAREDLNRYDLDEGVARLSKIFDWFSEDFTGEHGIRQVLATYGPAKARELVERGDFDVEYLSYDKSLNAQ